MHEDVILVVVDEGRKSPRHGGFWDWEWEAMSPFSETNDQVPLAPNLQGQAPIIEAPWSNDLESWGPPLDESKTTKGIAK